MEIDERWKKALETEARYKEEMSNAVISFLKDKVEGITFEKAEKILSDTINALHRMSKRKEI